MHTPSWCFIFPYIPVQLCSNPFLNCSSCFNDRTYHRCNALFVFTTPVFRINLNVNFPGLSKRLMHCASLIEDSPRQYRIHQNECVVMHHFNSSVLPIWGQVRRGSMVIRQRLKEVGIIAFLEKQITSKVTEHHFVHKITSLSAPLF